MILVSEVVRLGVHCRIISKIKGDSTFYYEILYVPPSEDEVRMVDEKYSGKYRSCRLAKYNNVNLSRATGPDGGYNWRNVNEPGIHGSLRIFSLLYTDYHHPVKLLR